MTSTEQDINDAIKSGTLDDLLSVAELFKRRKNFEADWKLLPDIRKRGLFIFDTAINVDAGKAIKAGVLVVSVLQRVLNAIGSLYKEHDDRTAQSAPDSESTVKHESEVKDATASKESKDDDVKLRKQFYDMAEQVIESRELLDYDEPDGFEEEEYESESDYGKPSNGKGKRKRGRPKTKPIEEVRVALAVEARQKRKRLSHGTPDSGAKNPKRHLFGPISEWGDISITGSPTPAVSAARSRMKTANASGSSHSPTSGRMVPSRISVQAESTPSKQSTNPPSSPHSSVKPTTQPSLIVKLKTREPIAPKPVPKQPRKQQHPRKLRSEYKSAAVVDSDSESDEKKGESPNKTSQETMPTKQRATRKRATSVYESDEQEEASKEEKDDFESHVPEAIPRNRTTRVTRQMGSDSAARGKQPASTPKTKKGVATSKQPEISVPKTRNNASVAPQPKQGATTRNRRGAISSSIKLFESPPSKASSPAQEDSDSDPRSDSAIIPNTSSPPLIPTPRISRSNPTHSSPLTNIPATTITTTTPTLPPASSTRALAPIPPLPHRALTPFLRGARIALENILSDHQADPLSTLIDLIEELDDTRPIVNDWEHVAVMKGGSWVYQVMRDVWEEAVDSDGDGDGDGNEAVETDGDVDIEDVVREVGRWVDREVERLGGERE